MIKKYTTVLYVTLLLTIPWELIGCSPKHIDSRQIVKRAPTSQAETGYIVSGISAAAITSLAEKFPDSKYREVNKPHGIYEVHGLSYEQIKNDVNDSNVIIEQNRFIELKKLNPDSQFSELNTLKRKKNLFEDASEIAFNNMPIDADRHQLVQLIESIHNIKLSGDILDFVNECILDQYSAPEIIIDDNQKHDLLSDTILYEVGAVLNLSAARSKENSIGAIPTPQGNLKFQWIITTPNDSALMPTAFQNADIEYNADTTGVYIVSIVAKDSLNFCNLDAQPFYVTANDDFAPVNPMPDSLSDSLDANTFWHLIHVGSREMWKQALGSGMVIGIIDTGVNYNHRSLASNININSGEIPNNNIDDDGNGFIDDYVGYDFGHNDGAPFDDYGHGSHVAGIAASNIFGAARKAQILSAKVGAILGFDVASVTGALRYSVDQGANVINMSLGWPDDLAVIRSALQYAETKNALVVAAAGNETANNDKVPSYPANYPYKNLISVAATDENDILTDYSNYGEKVHIAAPGGTSAKPIISSTKKNPLNRELVGLAGTSMAAPLVAGVAAQVWSAQPDLSATELRSLLIDSGRSAPDLMGKISSGKIIDARNALSRLTQTGPESSLVP